MCYAGRMLSAIVLAPSDLTAANMPAALVVRTLAALVPLVVQGLVRDVVLVGPAIPALSDIADQGGCALSPTLAGAMAAARVPWLLVITAGFAPEAGFADEAGDFIAAGRGAALMLARPDGLFTRLFPDSAALAGVILPRSTPSASDLAGLARLAAPRKTLATRARRVG